jgi:hypothetical protein
MMAERFELAAVDRVEVSDPTRPRGADGWSMLKATKTGTLRGPGGELVEVKAGTSRIHYSHWSVRRYPEWFRVIDKRDVRTAREHARALESVRADLERGRPATRTASRRGGVLPPKPAAARFRLPRPARTRRV